MKYKKKKNKILNYFTLTYIILYMINKLSINIQTVTEQVSIISVNDKQAVRKVLCVKQLQNKLVLFL